jgi:hypothetical protein
MIRSCCLRSLSWSFCGGRRFACGLVCVCFWARASPSVCCRMSLVSLGVAPSRSAPLGPKPRWVGRGPRFGFFLLKARNKRRRGGEEGRYCTLGMNRLRSHICISDCRLRVKQALPPSFTSACKAAKAVMQLRRSMQIQKEDARTMWQRYTTRCRCPMGRSR